MQNEMHMMTWQNATRKQMTWQRRRITDRHLGHRTRGVTEGARRALARAKVHWGKMDAEKLVTDAPPPGKEYRTPEMYYKSVLKGARTIAGECSNNVIFE